MWYTTKVRQESSGLGFRVTGVICSVLIGVFGCPGLLAAGEQVEGTAMAWERITVSSPVEEIVAEVGVEEGDVVEKGALLVQLQAKKQELEVLRLDKLIDKARFSFEATTKLFEQNIESRETMLEKKAELDQLLVEREIAQALVEERRITSPIAGKVVHRLKDPGESIGRVEPLIEIIDVSRLKLMLFLPASYVGSLTPGTEFEVEFPEYEGLGKGLKAKLIFIDPQVDARSGLFRARFEFDNSEHDIKPGVRVQVKLPKPS